LGPGHGAPGCTSTFRRLSLAGRGSTQADGPVGALAQLLVSLGCERHCRIVSAIGTFGCALIFRARRLSACSSRSATPVETVHPLGNLSIPRRRAPEKMLRIATPACCTCFVACGINISRLRESGGQSRPRRASARSISRWASRLAISRRLSHWRLPLARAISTLANPCVRYMRVGTMV